MAEKKEWIQFVKEADDRKIWCADEKSWKWSWKETEIQRKGEETVNILLKKQRKLVEEISWKGAE